MKGISMSKSLKMSAAAISASIAATFTMPAQANNEILDAIANSADESIEHYDKAYGLCNNINTIVAPVLKDAGIERELTGTFEAANTMCSISLGGRQVRLVLGANINGNTNVFVAEEIVGSMTRDERVKARDTLPELLAAMN